MQLIRTSDIEAAGFMGRNAALEAETRFRRFEVMFHRTNLLIHTDRVNACYAETRQALDVYNGEFEHDGAQHVNHFHDEPELKTHDIPAYHKARMNLWQRSVLSAREYVAIGQNWWRWPGTIHGHSYLASMLEGKRKRTLRAQDCSLNDKDVDCFGEAIHEVLAGNKAFQDPLRTILNNRAAAEERFPALRPLLRSGHPFYAPVKERRLQELIDCARPHTSESVREPTGIAAYDAWRAMTLRYFGEGPLITQVEKYEK